MEKLTAYGELDCLKCGDKIPKGATYYDIPDGFVCEQCYYDWDLAGEH